MCLFKDLYNDSDFARAFRSLDKNVQQILADMFVDMSTDAAEKLSIIKAAGMLDKINTTVEGGVKNKIKTTETGIKYVVMDGNFFLKNDGSEMSPVEAYNAIVGKQLTQRMEMS